MTLSAAIAYLLDEFHLGDQVYTVRDRAMERERGAYQGNSWEHPAVLKFIAAVDALEHSRKKP